MNFENMNFIKQALFMDNNIPPNDYFRFFITYCDFNNRFRYIELQNKKNDIRQYDVLCVRLIAIPKWYPTSKYVLKPLLYLKSLPSIF